MTQSGEIAVLDVGKTNVDIWVADRSGTLLENRSVPNRVLSGPPWQHHDMPALAEWVGRTLAELCRAHPVRWIVPVGHGSGGVLVGSDPDAGGTGLVVPMIDYEQPCPPEIDAEYRQEAGSFEDRGSPVMMASTHAARQLLWMERAAPAGFATARSYLNIAQYWGWWLSGVAASEYSAMGAQSHLWNVPQRRWTPIVKKQGWQRLMPPFRAATSALGPVRNALARRFGLPPDLCVLTGAHDSTSNYYRYVAGGLTDFTLVSTGTWVVALSAEADVVRLNERRGTSINADMEGNPVGGALVMGGRDFSAIAGAQMGQTHAELQVLADLVQRRTMSLPSFSDNDGQFPGSGRKGRIIGPPPGNDAERCTLAALHAAMLTATCADALNGGTKLVLDGTFLRDPLFAPIVAALCQTRPTLMCDETHGVIVGAVRLSDHLTGTTDAALSLSPVKPVVVPGLAGYYQSWRTTAEAQGADCQ